MRREVWLAVGVAALLLAYVYLGDTVDQAAAAYTGNPTFTRWDDLMKRKATQFRVPWRWLKVIILNESSNGQAKSVQRGLADPSDVEGSKSSDGKSWGLFQVTHATAKGLTGREVSAVELNNPEFSAELAARLVRELVDTFGYDFEKVMRAYNGGPKAAKTSSVLTTPYYVKSLANLKLVMAAHPGGELDFA